MSAQFFTTIPAIAHKPSDSYITLKRVENEIHAQWDIALRDLDYALELDKNNDGIITWGELRNNHKIITDYALPKFKMRVNNEYCTNQSSEQLLVDNHTDGAYAVLNFIINCPEENKTPKIFDLEYSLFFDFDPQHRGLLNIQHKDKTLTAIFSPEKAIQHFNLNSLNPWYQFIDFLKEGVWHIWIGFDHILFLLALLLPAVLIRRNNNWEAVPDFKKAFWNIFKVITAFTLAHSVTLSLAVLGFINLPSRLVESTIALSVVLAALNNIFPFVKEGRWLVAYCFGLIHGFGFASVLMDLELSKNSLLISLLSFNLGVEVGQLVIVCITIPIIYMLRNTNIYKNIIFTGASILIALLALIWFLERAFNLVLITAG